MLYVNGLVTNCTDTGTGTQAAPYCTIQAAANAAVAGDTVDITGGRTTGLWTSSPQGTAAAPIVFQPVAACRASSTRAARPVGRVTFDGASYVVLRRHRPTAVSTVAPASSDSTPSKPRRTSPLNGTSDCRTGSSVTVSSTAGAHLEASAAYPRSAPAVPATPSATNIIEGSDALHGISVSRRREHGRSRRTPSPATWPPERDQCLGARPAHRSRTTSPPSPVGRRRQDQCRHLRRRVVRPTRPSTTTSSFRTRCPLLLSRSLIPGPGRGYSMRIGSTRPPARVRTTSTPNPTLGDLTRSGSAPQLNSANSSAPGMLATDYVRQRLQPGPVLP